METRNKGISIPNWHKQFIRTLPSLVQGVYSAWQLKEITISTTQTILARLNEQSIQISIVFFLINFGHFSSYYSSLAIYSCQAHAVLLKQVILFVLPLNVISQAYCAKLMIHNSEVDNPTEISRASQLHLLSWAFQAVMYIYATGEHSPPSKLVHVYIAMLSCFTLHICVTTHMYCDFS